jgi:hypothetical protein
MRGRGTNTYPPNEVGHHPFGINRGFIGRDILWQCARNSSAIGVLITFGTGEYNLGALISHMGKEHSHEDAGIDG